LGRHTVAAPILLSAHHMTERNPLSSQDRGQPYPPDVPDMERRVRFYPRQAVGLIVLALIPILAMLGLAGEHRTELGAASSVLQVTVEYPTRMRVTRHGVLRLEATNRSGGQLGPVRILLPASYRSGFADRELTRTATPDGEVVLPALGPGEAGTAHVDLLAQRAGRHHGTLRVIPVEGDTMTIPLRTFILP
jgi:hypothetical protein